jgi:hypothetical protein
VSVGGRGHGLVGVGLSMGVGVGVEVVGSACRVTAPAGRLDGAG